MVSHQTLVPLGVTPTCILLPLSRLGLSMSPFSVVSRDTPFTISGPASSFPPSLVRVLELDMESDLLCFLFFLLSAA